MADPLFKFLKGRRKTREPLPFKQTRRDELARVPYEQREGSGGGGHADLLKMLKGAYEFTPAADVGDVGTAIQDPSLMNVGIAGLAMLGGPPGDFAKTLLKAKRAAAAAKKANLAVEYEKGMKVTPYGKVAENMVLVTKGRLDAQKVKQEIGDAGKYYTETDVPISSLKIDKTVDASKAGTGRLYDTEGPIVIDSTGNIFDGRHRAKKALEEGKTSIKAMVPVSVGGETTGDFAKKLLKAKKAAGNVLTEKAIKRFGTTTDASKAGFIMPDGRMLDFTSKQGGRSEHKMIGQIFRKGQTGSTNIPDDPIKAFQKETGAVRFGDTGAGPFVDKYPGTQLTSKQTQKIVQASRGKESAIMGSSRHTAMMDDEDVFKEVAMPTAGALMRELQKLK